MCEGLGTIWVEEYRSFYRYASYPTHAGSFTYGQHITKLLTQEPVSELDEAKVLTTAIYLHLRVAEIVAATFPEDVEPGKVRDLFAEFDNLAAKVMKAAEAEPSS